jgi:large subunit ribosomal protein L5
MEETPPKTEESKPFEEETSPEKPIQPAEPKEEELPAPAPEPEEPSAVEAEGEETPGEEPELEAPETVDEAEQVPEEELEPEEEEEVEEEPEEDRWRIEAPIPSSMRAIKIGKVVINIAAGKSGEPLDRAITILENLTDQRPCTRRAKQTIRTFGIRKSEPIACMVTLRGPKAEAILNKTFAAIGKRISPRSFDRNGNFAFGIREHIDIPGQRYDPKLGIIGMDVMATVERRGYRVARKRRAKSKVAMSHRVKREEAIEFIKQRFGVEVGLPSE